MKGQRDLVRSWVRKAESDLTATELALAALLTPFAVELRYDEDFWPSLEIAREARDAALKIKQLVAQRLPQKLIEDILSP